MTNGRSLAGRMKFVWPTVALAALGCTGILGKPTGRAASDSADSSNGNGNDTPNGNGTGPASGNGNSNPNGNNSSGSLPGLSGATEPGRVTMRRLNRAEYDNTVHDLLGTSQTPGATTFPNDAPQLAFDNDADLQTMSPVLFTRYQTAAESLAAEVMGTPAQLNQVVGCDVTSTACAQTFITTFGQRAFRRPLTADEAQQYTTLMATAAQAGSPATEQFQTVIEAILMSPNFLFRPEFDADITSLTPHLLTPYETASRLSYTVYRSMPDQELFDAAANGKLATPADLQAQVQRMLASPKNAFGQTFPGQWLGTAIVANEMFDATLFPKFSKNPAMAGSMAAEVTSFFGEFLTQNLPVTQLMTAKFTYLDQNLAGLYGVASPAGTGLVRTALTTPQRGGLLTMGGILAITSYPTRTSLVRRGNYVLSQLLCAPAPAPPPDVPPFPETAVTASTQKQILEMHRTNPACAQCHNSMDPIGAAMENYDAIGQYRTEDAGQAIDATGAFAGAIALPNGGVGATFNGAQELAAAVAADPRFSACVAQKVMAYSLGRAVAPTLSASDQAYVAEVAKTSNGTIGVRDILMNAVASDTFRMRRGDPTTTTTGGM